MTHLIVRSEGPLRGRIRVPGDKSISHRSLLLGALAEGTSRISGFLPAEDCQATIESVRALGVEIETRDATTLLLHGSGLQGLRSPAAPLHCARSGTTMRLLAGILAGQSFESVLTGDPQLLRRPMRRVTEPLCRMGAKIEDTTGRAPLAIHGRRLRSCEHTLPIASAQVKSALLLAGLYADGFTTVHQPGPARDHTERMLVAMGANVEVNGLTVTLSHYSSLAPLSLHVPGDISSAAFLLTTAALIPGSEISIENVGVNPTRTGLLDVLRAMGADVALSNECERRNEPVAEVKVRASDLHGIEVSGHTVVRMIDEFPVLAVAATQAHGETIVHDAAELCVKETDRIGVIASELRALGAQIEPLPDGFIVEGPTPLHGAAVDSHGDHRLAMALVVAGMIAEGDVVVENVNCIADSFPGFIELMGELTSNSHFEAAPS